MLRSAPDTRCLVQTPPHRAQPVLAHALLCQRRIMRPQRRKNVRMLRRRRLPHGWQMEVVILDSADVEHQGARELRHIGVARRLHDHFVEPLVARHHRRRVVLFACRLRV